MSDGKRRSNRCYLAWAAWIFWICFGCGGGADSGSQSGSYRAELIFPESIPASSKGGGEAGPRIDCEGAGIAFIRSHIYGGGGEHLKEALWPCAKGGGVVGDIPAGSGLRAIVTAEDQSEQVLLRGEDGNITIVAGQTSTGQITMTYSNASAEEEDPMPEDDPAPEVDNDGDGFAAARDCNDEDPAIHPEADEIPGNFSDENCDGVAEQPPVTEGEDLDNDGFSSPADCNENDPNIHPDAEEIGGNYIDENCDGRLAAPPSFAVEALGMTFVRIPAGEFLMGSPESEPGRGADEARHRVRISRDFYLQTTEVTQRQWREIMAGTDIESPSHCAQCGDTCPVENVTWSMVTDQFLVRLNERYAGRYRCRLPTEAQWEYAARAGSETAFANGPLTAAVVDSAACEYDANLDAMGWYCFNSEVDFPGYPRQGRNLGPHPVADSTITPNEFGLYDMHGNVMEWCQDWYEEAYSYTSEPIADPTGPDHGSYRVLRGGDFYSHPMTCRSAYRSHWVPIQFSPEIINIVAGFRMVCSSLNN